MLNKKNYYVSKNDKTNDVVYFEYSSMDGYQVNPKAKKNDEIEVSKIIFISPDFSEKIIRRKIDKRIALLLQFLNTYDENGDPDEGGLRRNLMDAEKLRLQIINKYVKYLGHTYQSLTLKKIQIIINQLRYKLYTLRDLERENVMYDVKEGRKGR